MTPAPIPPTTKTPTRREPTTTTRCFATLPRASYRVPTTAPYTASSPIAHNPTTTDWALSRRRPRASSRASTRDATLDMPPGETGQMDPSKEFTRPSGSRDTREQLRDSTNTTERVESQPASSSSWAPNPRHNRTLSTPLRSTSSRPQGQLSPLTSDRAADGAFHHHLPAAREPSNRYNNPSRGFPLRRSSMDDADYTRRGLLSSPMSISQSQSHVHVVADAENRPPTSSFASAMATNPPSRDGNDVNERLTLSILSALRRPAARFTVDPPPFAAQSVQESNSRHRLLQLDHSNSRQTRPEVTRRQMSPDDIWRQIRQDWDGIDVGELMSRPSTIDRPSAIDTVFKIKVEAGKLKKVKGKFEGLNGKEVAKSLIDQDAVATMLYRSATAADPQANDIWPSVRDSSKLPAKYYRIDKTFKQKPHEAKNAHQRPTKVRKIHHTSDVTTDTVQLPTTSSFRFRPVWGLPVEVVELITDHLTRDDIKALRLVSRDFDHNVSRILFKTVVVPFNTEIYGMLGQKQDIKGKGKATPSNFIWKNANGDDVYNGHGLDVFRGFGAHIVRYGMSFEVTEDALARPPVKILAEQHESFWGTFDWPFVEYRRFEDVAGLESAADETPIMKTAFSELSKVKELALSVDAGLGWLHGPDRSIRARILQKSPAVFGTRKKVPDRRTFAQREFWQHIEDCYAGTGKNLTLATLYKIEANRSASDMIAANLSLQEQPEIPFMDPRIISEALPNGTATMPLPTSFEDPEVLDSFVTPQTPSASGILFTSKIKPLDAGQLMSPVMPSTLTKAQKEWLMETEWAQRAFISSYMLSIIDNPKTFNLVHTLNIARLSDRYVSMLNRQDFWAALPNLENVTLMVLPCWRTIKKNASGAADTPKVDPSSEIDSIFSLLQAVVTERSNIKTLTIGWATGGEHEEGVHGRNKLLQPAPLLPFDMITNQDARTLRKSLLKFRHVKHLTIKNCWITPLALKEFVAAHDRLSLEHLVLDSVSLTGALKYRQHTTNPTGQTIQVFDNLGVAGLAQAQALHAHSLAQGNRQGQQQDILSPLQFFTAQFQLLQIRLHQVQSTPGGDSKQVRALQAQLQQLATHGPGHFHSSSDGNAYQLHVQGPLSNIVQQVIQNHNQWQQAQPVLPPLAPATVPAAGQILRLAEPAEDSWLEVIDAITPGPSIRDADEEFPGGQGNRPTSLQTIEFISCGYVRLPYSPLDQGQFDDTNLSIFALRVRTDPIFTKRALTLAPSMLSARWPLLGEIVQEMSAEELAMLNVAWDMEDGWKDADEAKAVEFDGLLPGGTGRFTGVVHARERWPA